MTASHATLPRQALLFLLSGLAQLVLDSAVYVGLSAAGLTVLVANVAGRVSGACLGYWLNGRYTFAEGGRARLGRWTLLRFVLAWTALTVLSTVLLSLVAGEAGLRASWLAKPAVEAMMAAIGFFVWRHWVYR